ncbi:MAG TPA: SLC13 family permease [Candidatus Limnocylindrales bacterium]|nr:SLC13 family permease [Candidatus Limnocylindrales bacterium]
MAGTDFGRRAGLMRRAALRPRRGPARLVAGVALASALVIVALAGRTLLGRLGDPFALLIVLPPLAVALAAFGLRDLLARRIAAIRTGERRLLAAYALWLGTSAVLTLDVAAVAAGSVAMAIGRDRGERRWQLGAAVLGANIGSLLFPFSNLTNLVLVAASGMTLATYLAAAAPAQIAAAVAGGVLLVGRFLAEQASDTDSAPADDDPPIRYRPSGGAARIGDRGSTLAACVAAAAAIVAVLSGLTGGSMVWPFVAGAAILVAWSVGDGRLEPATVLDSTPWRPLLVIVVAAIASGPIASLAGVVPRPHGTDPLSLVVVMIAGGALAATVNNLPAAAFGAAWIGASDPAVVIAWLIGTNFAALVTPHGSVATLLARAAARRHGPTTTVRDYLGNAWRYAAATSIAAVACLAVIHP